MVFRADMLLLAEKDEEYRGYLSRMALRLAGDEAILKAMGEERERRGWMRSKTIPFKYSC